MLDTMGPMCKSVREVAVLQVVAGYDGIDPRMTAETPLRENVKNYRALLDSSLKGATGDKPASGLRMGLLKNSFAVPGLSDVVRDTGYRAAKKEFTAAGADVKDISIPMHTLGPAIWTAATRESMAEFAVRGQMPGCLSYHPPHIKLQWPMDQELFGLLTATNPAVSNLVLVSKHLKSKFGHAPEAKAHGKVFELRAAYDAAFKEVDILVTPCTPTVAMPHPKLKLQDGEGSSVMEELTLSIGSTSNTCAFNVTGHPAISVPCGFAAPEMNGTTAKLPIGMQLVSSFTGAFIRTTSRTRRLSFSRRRPVVGM
jgi:amidase